MNRDREFDLTVPVGPIDHLLGRPHCPVTIVEYGDFERPNCKQAAPGVRLLLARYAGRVRFAYRHFPLEDVHLLIRSSGLAASMSRYLIRRIEESPNITLRPFTR
jgi:Thioredoxin